jgi:adenylate cyclase class IV
MIEEKEIKIEVLEKFNTKELIKKLKLVLPLKFISQKITKDIYFDTANKDLFNLNHALRLRESKKESSIAYKALFYTPQRKQSQWFILEKEFNFLLKKEQFIEIFSMITLPNLNLNLFKNISSELSKKEIQKIFLKMGFKKSIVLIKKRYSFKCEKSIISLDDIKNLGIFIEIESPTHEELESILKKISFNFKQERYGYTNIYSERILNIKIPDYNKKYTENPEWNYLPGQKEIVNNFLLKN